MFTGTYWSSHSSLLQQFIESVLDDLDNAGALIGKVAAIVVTMESTGGQAVASNLMNTLNTMGFLLPPCSYVVISRATEVAWKTDETVHGWNLKDLDITIGNFLKALELNVKWDNWECYSESSISF